MSKYGGTRESNYYGKKAVEMRLLKAIKYSKRRAAIRRGYITHKLKREYENYRHFIVLKAIEIDREHGTEVRQAFLDEYSLTFDAYVEAVTNA